MRLVSNVGAKGTSYMTLSGGKGLGPDGAQRLADLLREAPTLQLASLGIRHNIAENNTPLFKDCFQWAAPRFIYIHQWGPSLIKS